MPFITKLMKCSSSSPLLQEWDTNQSGSISVDQMSEIYRIYKARKICKNILEFVRIYKARQIYNLINRIYKVRNIYNLICAEYLYTEYKRARGHSFQKIYTLYSQSRLPTPTVANWGSLYVAEKKAKDFSSNTPSSIGFF